MQIVWIIIHSFGLKDTDLHLPGDIAVISNHVSAVQKDNYIIESQKLFCLRAQH